MLTDEYLNGILAVREYLLHNALYSLPVEAIVAAADPWHGHFGDFMVPL